MYSRYVPMFQPIENGSIAKLAWKKQTWSVEFLLRMKLLWSPTPTHQNEEPPPKEISREQSSG